MTETIKCPYQYKETRRRPMARFIAFGRSPYYAQGDVFPLTYNVKVYQLQRTSFGDLWEHYALDLLQSYLGVKDPFAIAEAKPALEEWYNLNASSCEEVAIEDARRSLTDGDTYKMTWDGDTVHKVTFEFCGRGGGHLCITEIDGMSTKVPPHALYEQLMCKSSWTCPQLRELYKLAVQWGDEFTQENARKEVEYQLAWNLFVNVAESIIDPPRTKKETDLELQSTAG